MFIHDAIKIMYANMGYLSGCPYYLVSDKEMFDAFTRVDGFFNDFYPCPDASLQEPYDILRSYIFSRIEDYLSGKEVSIPNWVYSYMIMNPITFESPLEDISYLYDLANIIAIGAPVFDSRIANMCYETSVKWIQKQPSHASRRPPTVFGEPHVIKSLRLNQSNILIE